MTVDDELERHRKTWHSFTRMIVYSSAATIVVLILMATFLL